jgi:hypothetical protein
VALVLISSGWSPAERWVLMHSEIKQRLLYSFEGMEVDVKNLQQRLRHDEDFKFKDFREVELLEVIMKDEMAAEVDELSCNVECRDYAAVENNLRDLQNLMECLILARCEAQEEKLSKQ